VRVIQNNRVDKKREGRGTKRAMKGLKTGGRERGSEGRTKRRKRRKRRW